MSDTRKRTEIRRALHDADGPLTPKEVADKADCSIDYATNTLRSRYESQDLARRRRATERPGKDPYEYVPKARATLKFEVYQPPDRDVPEPVACVNCGNIYSEAHAPQCPVCGVSETTGGELDD